MLFKYVSHGHGVQRFPQTSNLLSSKGLLCRASRKRAFRLQNYLNFLSRPNNITIFFPSLQSFFRPCHVFLFLFSSKHIQRVSHSTKTTKTTLTITLTMTMLSIKTFKTLLMMFALRALRCCHGFVLESELSAPALPSTFVALQQGTSSEEKPRPSG